MADDLYTKTFDVIPGNRVGSQLVENEFALVETALDKLPTLPQMWSGSSNYAVAGGAVNVYTATIANTHLTSYTDGLSIIVKFGTPNNTTTPTVNLNALGAKTIERADGTALAVGELTGVCQLTYNSTSGKFQMTSVSAVNTSAAAASAAAAAASAASALSSANTATTKTAEANASAIAAAASAVSAEAARAAAVVAQNNAVSVVTGGTASLVAAASRIPISDANGRLHPSWLAAISQNLINHIGVPGTAGFGQGICPSPPAGFTPLPGCTDVLSANYGNYQFTDGSVMVWIPAFYFRIGHAGNPTHGADGANSIDIEPLSYFPNEATANAEGYYLHRAFVNAGANQLGFFRDKFDCSNNSGTASSIASQSPIVAGPLTGQVGFAALTGTPASANHGAIAAAKTRGTLFMPESVFMADAIARITDAHAQASTSTTYCAWWSASTTNFPKGNNNGGAMRDINDAAVTFTSAGAAGNPNVALTGSGSNFAKTTHNGQACGISDVNGNIAKINLGLMNITVNRTITGASATNPVSITATAHGYSTGDVRYIRDVGGMTQLNNRFFVVTVTGTNTFTLDGVDGTAFSAYTSGGSSIGSTFYTLKTSVDYKTITSGTSLSTDHWGATGAAAMFDAIVINFPTTYPNNGQTQLLGNGSNAVFDMSTSTNRTLAMMGVPLATGVSASGTTNFGQDGRIGDATHEMCVISRGNVGNGTPAGSRNASFTAPRASAGNSTGLACVAYLT